MRVQMVLRKSIHLCKASVLWESEKRRPVALPVAGGLAGVARGMECRGWGRGCTVWENFTVCVPRGEKFKKNPKG